MEKISIQTTYTRVSLYARYSGATAPKKSDADKADGDEKRGTDLECGRSQDGDTFSLSIEARTIQISETYEISGYGAGKASGDAAGGTTASPGAAKTAAADESSGGGLVHALLDALKTISASRAKQGRDEKHRHHFLSLANPQDVAENLLEQISQRHAAQGGSKAEAAADIKKRLADWAPATGKVAIEYREFRSEVHLRLCQGLDAWVQDEVAPASPSSAAAGDVTGTSADTGFDSV